LSFKDHKQQTKFALIRIRKEQDFLMDNFNQEYRLIENVMHIRLSGKFPHVIMNSSGNVFQLLIDECTNKKCNKVLIDICDLEINLSTLELLRAGKDAASLNKLGLQLALVARKETISTFFDDVAFNRGGRVRVFTDKEGALEWLNS
jgi:hypothetical protein